MSWKHINDKWLDFAIDSCNVRLRLTLDGVNPFGDLSSCHFTWPMILLNYNLPPWLVTKRYFLMLALIILGKESVISGNLDVYLQPLIKELQVLWQGVQAFDATLWVPFTLKAMCMWSIHNFPAYGLFTGCVTKSHVGCPPCDLATKSRSSRKFFKPFILWESMLSIKEPSLLENLGCFQWGNRIEGCTYASNCC
jgi:hypothetical protein